MVLLVFISLLNPVDAELDHIRTSFHQSLLDESKIEDFYNLSQEVDTSSALGRSYKAVGYIMKAKNEWNPIEQLILLSKYQRGINQAIESEPDNVEIRFLRFSVAHYLPDVFGLKKNMKEDKEVMMSNLDGFDLSSVNDDFDSYILWFLDDCGFYTPDELELIKQHLN